MIMIAHGLLAALSFAISGYFYKQAGTLDMDKLGGFLQRMPFIGSVFVMAAMAGCGLPGFANFVGEAMALFAAYKYMSLITSIAVWGGLVIAAIYMLRAVRDILHGPLPDEFAAVSDAQGWWRKLPYALLFTALLLFGVWPSLLTKKIEPAAQQIVALVTRISPTQAEPAVVAQRAPAPLLTP
jgi:NADH-quinone oxidoreductase subunit M